VTYRILAFGQDGVSLAVANALAQGSAVRSAEVQQRVHAVDGARRALDIIRARQPHRNL
jgi:hypothetical protein